MWFGPCVEREIEPDPVAELDAVDPEARQEHCRGQEAGRREQPAGQHCAGAQAWTRADPGRSLTLGVGAGGMASAARASSRETVSG